MKREYGRCRYHNISENKKQKLKKYQKNIVKLTRVKRLYFYGFNNI